MINLWAPLIIREANLYWFCFMCFADSQFATAWPHLQILSLPFSAWLWPEPLGEVILAPWPLAFSCAQRVGCTGRRWLIRRDRSVCFYPNSFLPYCCIFARCWVPLGKGYSSYNFLPLLPAFVSFPVVSISLSGFFNFAYISVTIFIKFSSISLFE